MASGFCGIPTQAQYGSISNSPLEFLFYFLLKIKSNTFFFIETKIVNKEYQKQQSRVVLSSSISLEMESFQIMADAKFNVTILFLFQAASQGLQLYKNQTPLTLICINWVPPRDPRTIFLGTSFTQKMPDSSDSMYYSIFMLENMISSFYPKWTEFTRNCEFHSKYGSRGNQTKLEQNSQFLVNSVHFR